MELNSSFLKYHEITGLSNEILWKILDKEHKNLKKDLCQLFEDEDRIKFYQFKLDKSERMVFVIKSDSFIPIIFDLNHVLYFDNKKGHKTTTSEKKYEWNFKNEQEEYKKRLIY